jgi:nitroreductase
MIILDTSAVSELLEPFPTLCRLATGANFSTYWRYGERRNRQRTLG